MRGLGKLGRNRKQAECDGQNLCGRDFVEIPLREDIFLGGASERWFNICCDTDLSKREVVTLQFLRGCVHETCISARPCREWP